MRGLDPRICRRHEMAGSSPAMTVLYYVMRGLDPLPRRPTKVGVQLRRPQAGSEAFAGMTMRVSARGGTVRGYPSSGSMRNASRHLLPQRGGEGNGRVIRGLSKGRVLSHVLLSGPGAKIW